MIVPAVILLLLGAALLVVEIFLPGFGAPGILGIASVIAGYAVWQPGLQEALVITLLLAVIIAAAVVIAAHSAARGRLANSKLILHETSFSGEKCSPAQKGDMGVASTALRPAGIVLINGKKISAVSDGDFIESGTSVVVTEADGNRICVTRQDS